MKTKQKAIPMTYSQAPKVTGPMPTAASAFASMDQWKKERDQFAKEIGQIGKRFNQFVRDTIRYFYVGGGNNVVLVNGLLQIAHNSRMANKQRLAAYLMEVIPHDLHDKASKDKAPRFGAKSKDAVYDFAQVEAFLRVNLEWNKYGKESTPEAFKVDSYLKNVLATLRRNKVDTRDAIGKLLTAAIEAEAKDAAKKAAGASR